MVVSIDIMGGLGNQIFQIFNVIAYSLKYNKTFILPRNMNKWDKRKPYWDTFLINLKKYTTADSINFPLLKEKTFQYNIIPNFNNDFKFHGYFQSFKYFEQHFGEICELIDIKNIKLSIAKKYNYYFNNETISLHFRLGDYKQLQHIHPLMPIQYYINSIQYIINKTNKDNYDILYFCQRQDNDLVNISIKVLKNKFKNINFIKVDDEIEDWKQMLIMSLCNYNIIANSTFSWWGAYFNSNREKIVCYPYYWFGSGVNHNTDDLFPNNWSIINF
jgi:hypothetical protein